jgi:hypothetical protein
MQTIQLPISLHDAAQKGITSLRYVGKDKFIDHIDIDIIEKAVGPWVNVYLKDNASPSKELLIEYLGKKSESYFDDKCFVPYEMTK